MPSKKPALIKFSDIKKYVEDRASIFDAYIDDFEDKAANARNNENIPIYLTRCRVKDINDIYLKTKRRESKIRKISDLQDIVGFRILCLFEADIFNVYTYLLDNLNIWGYHIHEIEVYTWNNEFFEKEFNTRKERHLLTDCKFKDEQKNSGYKSIHLGVTGHWTTIEKRLTEEEKESKQDYNQFKYDYKIEIQLRSLLQDVWGELEHKLNYKRGNIHPHIKKSFDLLSKDLQTTDILLNHLKDIKEKQELMDMYSLPKTAFSMDLSYPLGYFTSGEPINVKTQFRGFSDEVINAIKDYEAFCREHFKDPKNESGDEKLDIVSKAEKKLNGIRKLLNAERKYHDLKLERDCWLKMEEAYFYFRKEKYDDAMQCYNDIIDTHKMGNQFYMAYYRRGEIYFIRQDICNALKDFDECEAILGDSSDEQHIENKYFVMARLANIYWLLGADYIDLAIDRINEARKIMENYDSSGSIFSNRDRYYLQNSICFYNLERYIMNKGNNKKDDKCNESFRIAEEYFDEIEKILKEDIDIRNLYDTAAWFSFYKYDEDKDINYLEKAAKYIDMALKKKITLSPLVMVSLNIQLHHYQEIMHAVDQIGKKYDENTKKLIDKKRA